jgi:2-(1,2-epoxy-1,2-dihydrophenyl)acetyl-CoA isomerase
VEYKDIILKKEEGVAIITLNRPEKLNAATDRLVEELVDAIKDTGEDSSVRVVVLTGAGRGFCAGIDLDAPMFSVTSSVDGMKAVEPFGKVSYSIRNLPKPVIASVNGVAAGGGCGWALACDIIIASENARFTMAFINVGLHPDCGSIYFLPRLVGVAKACELLFTGDVIDAEEAGRIGLVNKVVPADQLEAATRELALRIAEGPPIALGMAKTSIYEALGMDLASVIEMEARALSICLLTQDCKEGVKAIKEKRKPHFMGK